jgi:hypothetical protein
MNKVRVIERSIRCQALGWVGVLPVLGVIPAVIAIVLYHKASSEAGDHWNPSEQCARSGFVLSWIGLGLSAILVAVGGAVLISHLRG